MDGLGPSASQPQGGARIARAQDGFKPACAAGPLAGNNLGFGLYD